MAALHRTIAAAVLLVALTAEATTLLQWDLPALIDRSDAIVRGRVVAVEARWSGDKRVIFREVRVAVDEALVAGGVQDTVTIQELGGTVGDIAQHVDGMALFTPGEEVVLFLGRRGTRLFELVGMAQGKYRVERSAPGAPVLAVPARLGEARLLDPNTLTPSRAGPVPVTLDRLRALVKRRVAPVRSSP